MRFIGKRNIVYGIVSSLFFWRKKKIANECLMLIGYQNSFNGSSSSFMSFDNVSKENIFVTKTKSFLLDDFVFGMTSLLKRDYKEKFFFIDDISDIRNERNVYILPTEYDSKLIDGSIVVVEVLLRL